MNHKVCFITPPSPFLLDERVFPALGILKVAAAAEQAGWEVEHLDLNGVVNATAIVAEHAAQTDAAVFAVTATTPQMPAAHQIAAQLSHVRPDARRVLGGPHPTLVHAASRKTTRAQYALAQLAEAWDCIVAGDGEDMIDVALSAQANRPMLLDADTPGQFGFIPKESIGSTPWPLRRLVDLQSYHYWIDGVRATPLIAQYGCPFACNFCAGRNSPMLRRARQRSTADVLQEFEALALEGWRGFMAFDDELNVNRDFVGLLHGLIAVQERLGVEFRLRGFVKAELFTEEQAKLMAAAGFRQSMCGFESGSPRILRNIHKQATRDDNTRVMEWSHKYGLGMKALMSLGHPGESPDTVQDTINWLLEVMPEQFDCTLIQPYPGSPYWDQAIPADGGWMFEAHGDRLYMMDVDYTQTANFYKGAPGAYESFVWTDALSRQALVLARDCVEREVRQALGLGYYQAQAGQQFEASMGALPGFVYRKG